MGERIIKWGDKREGECGWVLAVHVYRVIRRGIEMIACADDGTTGRHSEESTFAH